MSDWHEKVYHSGHVFDKDQWEFLRELVLEHAGYKCEVMGCNRKRALTVHHIMPRRKGGPDCMENLICLCPLHHDIAEDEGIEDRMWIVNLPDDGMPVRRKPEARGKKIAEDWHAWVYGGYKRPD